MDIIFSLRLDKNTSNRLQTLADTTHRSRGAVVRWLINAVVLPDEPVTPVFKDPSMNTSIYATGLRTRSGDLEDAS